MLIDSKEITLTITASTDFKGSIAASINDILIGHIVQGEFLTSTNEIVWFEMDLPSGL